ncbi:MAG: PD-(D/E)XK nuclease family protein [Thermoleophilaceae bacterium]|nr:PD-(D/E)XK nuclease family protein [Thermoleophilaceae bacterium]
MPLTVITGPANAAKAGQVLGGLRARLEDEPILVVPTFQDVEHAQRELAERGAVFGARVLRFDWLFREIGHRADYREPVASEVQRELIVEQAARGAGLRVLAASSCGQGFTRAAARFVAELGWNMVDPGRLTEALRRWAGNGPRRAYAEEVAVIYRGYRERLDAAGLADPELFAWGALDALRRDPAAWGGTPLFVYGFDDFTPLELDALETVARRCGADVTVSLPFERGRLAFKAIARVRQELLARGAREIALPPLDDHYVEASRRALHHLERGLFEPGPVGRVDPDGAIAFHSAGGERAEVELAGARVLELLRDGVRPGELAVVFRDPGAQASLIEQVFGAYGIPYALDRWIPLCHTGVGRGLLALVRSAILDGSADDLLAYLRTPGLLRVQGLADRLEAQVRREGAHSAAEARELWEREHWKLDDLDRLRDAPDTGAFVAELDRRLSALFAGPYERRAPVLAGPEVEEARALAAAQVALADLRALLQTGAAGGLDRARVYRVLEQLSVHVGDDPQPDRVQVATPEAIRARRFAVVILCGLEEGEFPRPAAPEPFLSDEDRRAIARSSGLVLPVHGDRLDRERYLFYVCASRAERLLVLSSRSSDEEGNPEAESFFVDDVRDLFAPHAAERRVRSLSEVTWSPNEAPTAAEWDRALAAAGPVREERRPGPLRCEALLGELSARDPVSAGALERFADCPVKWLVEDVLRPTQVAPDPEAMVRGDYAHSVLEHTYRRLREETGERRVTPSNLARAERILLEELRARRSVFKLSPKHTRVRAAARRLEFDLLRHLRTEAESDAAFEPEYLELRFGDGEAREPVEIADGVRVRGRIDRVDTSDGMALVLDYKSTKRVDRYKAASWERENRFQAALYMLVVERLLELRPAGGVYVALGSDDPRPRGMVAADVEELGSRFFANDRLDPDAFRSKLAWALDRIRETDARMRRGELCSSPDTCAWNGGCSYPSICRSDR